MIRSRKALILYPIILSLFLTSVGLSLILRPKEGWIAWAVQTVGRLHETAVHLSSHEWGTAEQQVHYDIDAELDVANSIVHGVVSVTIQQVPDSKLLFYLYPWTYRPIQIQQVLVNGKPVSYQATAQDLTVPVNAKSVDTKVQIRFSTPIPAAGTRLGQKDGVWSLTYWYPILGVWQNGNWIPRPDPRSFGDPYLMDMASYHVRLKHPSDFRWYTSGNPVSFKQENGMTTSEWKSDNLRNFALVGGTGWHEATWTSPEGINMTIAVRNPDRLPKLQAIAEAAVHIYTNRFGPLAYSYLSVLEMPSGTVYAHEYPNLALFSEDIWRWSNGEHWIAHEIAHAWWFSSVGTHKALSPWLDEGLADYAAILYSETKYGADIYKQAIAGNWKLFRDGKSYAPHSFGTPVHVRDQAADQPYANFENEADYYYLMYLRPVLMYHDLRVTMGDRKFFAFLQQFYLKNRNGTVTRTHLEQALREVDPNALPLLKLWLDAPNEQVIQQARSRFEP